MIELDQDSLGLTVCQVPVVVAVTTGEAFVEILFTDGRTQRRPGLGVGGELSGQVFARSGEVARIHAYLPVETVGTAEHVG